MADRYLVDELVAAGAPDAATAADMVDRVTAGIRARLAAGRGVRLEGVGQIAKRTVSKRWFDRGMCRVDVTVVCLKDAAELHRSEPKRPS